MKQFLLLSLCLLVAPFLKGQEYTSTSIDENLKKDAFAVVRHNNEFFKQDDINNGVYKVTYVVTVLSEKGREFADFSIYEDSFCELKKFSGELFNAAGKTLKKIAKKDLTSTAFSSQLAIDGKTTYYECYAPGYPFTVKYEYEVKYKNGILMYPTFAPVTSPHLAVQHAEYTLQIPVDVNLRCNLQSGMPDPQRKMQGKDSVFRFEVKNYKALPYERYAPYQSLFPYALLSPSKFCINNACGDMSTWESFGKWQQKLLEGRSQLPASTISKITELTKDISGNKEKVKRLYEFLQTTTRYVSIQLGIGGWQPMPAAEVAKTGFGDCKALSNYMKAMLSAIGIPSYYTVISLNRERFFRDYPNFTQANHVILMVPLEKDTVWIECTSQILPFGYIHSSIMGHDALAIGDNDVFFCTLPSYADTENKELNNVTVHLAPDGTANMQVLSTYTMQNYEELLFKQQGLNNKEELDLFGRLLRVHKPLVKNIKKEEIKTAQPSLDLSYSLQCEDFASKTGSRLFVPFNPARTSLKGIFTSNTRIFDVKIPESLYQLDTITIQIPEEYEPESIPKPATIISDYGIFKSEVKQDGNAIVYMQALELRRGLYPAAKYNDLKQFFDKVESAQSGNLGFKKKTN